MKLSSGANVVPAKLAIPLPKYAKIKANKIGSRKANKKTFAESAVV